MAAFIHNSSLPLCRLPEELLVYIVKLVQGRLPVEGAADRVLISAFWRTMDQKHIQCLAWRHIMLTCRQVQATMLRNPEVWSLVASCWPERWVDLCVRRSKNFPLHVLCNVHSRVTVALAMRLIPLAKDVVLLIDGSTDGLNIAHYRALCLDILRLEASLRLLNVQVSGWTLWDRYNLIPLTIPLLGGPRSCIADLDLEHVHLLEVPAFPHLEHLRLSDVMPPSNPDWLYRWLRTTPKLSTLEFRVLVLEETHGVLTTTGPLLDLPHLSLTQFACPFDMAAFFWTLPLPSRRLSVTTRPSDREEDTLNLAPTNAASVYALCLYVEQFWARVKGDERLPPAVVNFDFDMDDLPMVSLEMRDGEDILGDALRFFVRVERISELGPLVPLVRSCRVDAPSLRKVKWSYADLLLNLERVRVKIRKLRGISDADGLQAWADERARTGRPPVFVEIGQHERGSIKVRGKYHVRVMWNPGAGPLAEADWTETAKEDLESEPESTPEPEADDDSDMDSDLDTDGDSGAGEDDGSNEGADSHEY
jgi:hypothetical protein